MASRVMMQSSQRTKGKTEMLKTEILKSETQRATVPAGQLMCATPFPLSAFQDVSVSVFSRADDLKSDAALPEFRRHGCKDCEEFIGLVQQLIDGFRSNTAIIPQQFQPKLRLIGFLEQTIELGAKLSVRARS
jgi:hypothetical protein